MKGIDYLSRGGQLQSLVKDKEKSTVEVCTGERTSRYPLFVVEERREENKWVRIS